MQLIVFNLIRLYQINN